MILNVKKAAPLVGIDPDNTEMYFTYLMQNFTDVIEIVAKEKGLSVNQILIESEISWMTYRRWKRGRNIPSWDKMVQIKRALEAQPTTLRRLPPITSSNFDKASTVG